MSVMSILSSCTCIFSNFLGALWWKLILLYFLGGIEVVVNVVDRVDGYVFLVGRVQVMVLFVG